MRWSWQLSCLRDLRIMAALQVHNEIQGEPVGGSYIFLLLLPLGMHHIGSASMFPAEAEGAFSASFQRRRDATLWHDLVMGKSIAGN